MYERLLGFVPHIFSQLDDREVKYNQKLTTYDVLRDGTSRHIARSKHPVELDTVPLQVVCDVLLPKLAKMESLED